MSLPIAASSSLPAPSFENNVARSPAVMADDVEHAMGSSVTSPQSAPTNRRGDWTRPQMCKSMSDANTVSLTRVKGIYTLVIVSLPAIIGFSSSVQVPALSAIALEFNSSRGLAAVSASTYLVGFGLGPFIFAPLSEVL